MNYSPAFQYSSLSHLLASKLLKSNSAVILPSIYVDCPASERIFGSSLQTWTILTVSENGEILAKKNQNFFGTEEDQVVYYKLKVEEE